MFNFNDRQDTGMEGDGWIDGERIAELPEGEKGGDGRGVALDDRDMIASLCSCPFLWLEWYSDLVCQ